MQRKRGELVPIGEVVSGLDDALVPGVLKKWEEGETTIPPPLSFLPALNQKKRRSSTLLLKSFRLQPRLSFVILIRLVVLRVRNRTLNRAP